MMTFSEVIDGLNKKKRTKHLLLGNGFSMAYDSKIFSYNALSNFVSQTDNELLKKLFLIIKTTNFELIMQQLATFAKLANEFSSDEDLETKITEASDKLKKSLIDAIQALHPEHVFKIPDEESACCAKFLNTFLDADGHIFTTNYDILLYWVLMKNLGSKISKATDGFGRDVENVFGDEFIPEDELTWSELRWGNNKDEQNIHYLHGALPIFDAGISIVKEEYKQDYLLDRIKKRIFESDYPVFVTAGDGKDKLNHILHNPYLSFCYDQLCNIEGSLVTFGFNFGQYDYHIIEAINVAAKQGKKTNPKLWSIYVGVYSDADLKYVERIKDKFKCKVNLYDAKTAGIWR